MRDLDHNSSSGMCLPFQAEKLCKMNSSYLVVEELGVIIFDTSCNGKKLVDRIHSDIQESSGVRVA
jgi:hypothetical protein